MIEGTAFEYVQRHIRSLWSLEVPLLLEADRRRSWSIEELVLELRSSELAIQTSLQNLKGAGLVAEASPGKFTTASSHVDELVAAIRAAYATRPAAVARAVAETSHAKIRLLADAFKLRRR